MSSSTVLDHQRLTSQQFSDDSLFEFKAIRPEPPRPVVSQCPFLLFFFLGFFCCGIYIGRWTGRMLPSASSVVKTSHYSRVLCNFLPDTHQVWLRSSTLAMDDCNDAPWRLLMQLPSFVSHSRAFLDSSDRSYRPSRRGTNESPVEATSIF